MRRIEVDREVLKLRLGQSRSAYVDTSKNQKSDQRDIKSLKQGYSSTPSIIACPSETQGPELVDDPSWSLLDIALTLLIADQHFLFPGTWIMLVSHDFRDGFDQFAQISYFSFQPSFRMP